MMVALLCLTVSACAHSQAIPDLDPAPILTTKTVVERRCPAEAVVEIPPGVVLPPGAVVSGNEAGLAYVGARFRREERLEARAADIKADCDTPPPERGD